MISCLSIDHQIAVIESRLKHFKRNVPKAINKLIDKKSLAADVDEAIADVERLLTRGK